MFAPRAIIIQCGRTSPAPVVATALPPLRVATLTIYLYASGAKADYTHGWTEAENVIAPLRCLYRYAVADGLIREYDNPALRVAKPRRLASSRHALPDNRLAEIVQVHNTSAHADHRLRAPSSISVTIS